MNHFDKNVFYVLLVILLAASCAVPLGQRKTLFTAKKATVSTVVRPNACFDAPSACVVDSKGNIYVSDVNNFAIRKISAEGYVTTLAGGGGQGFFDGTAGSARFSMPLGMDIDAQDNIYLADYGNHAIRKITPDGVVSTVAGGGVGNNTSNTLGQYGFDNKVGTAALFRSPTDVALDGNDNIYVVDRDNATIRMIDSSGLVSTVIGSESGGFGSLGHFTKTTTPLLGDVFTCPVTIAFDRKRSTGGNTVLYLGDGGGTSDRIAIRKLIIGNDGSIDLTDFAGSGSPGFHDGVGSSALFGSPSLSPAVGIFCIRVDSAGVVWVFDAVNSAIRKITGSQQVKTYAGGGKNETVGSQGIAGFEDGSTGAATVLFKEGGGLAFDKNGNTYVADMGNNAIRKITSSGTVITYAGAPPHAFDAGNGGFGDGPVQGARLSNPYGIARDSSGNLYVSDFNDNEIWKIAPSGQATLIIDTSDPFNGPEGLTVGPDDTLYIAEYTTSRIRAVNTKGMVTQYSGNVISPSGLVFSNGSLYATAQSTGQLMNVLSDGQVDPVCDGLIGPAGLAAAANGDLYVANQNVHQIWKVAVSDGSNLAKPFAGSSVAGNINGTAAYATFNQPTGVAFDTQGNLFVADRFSHQIRRISPDGMVSTVAGIVGGGNTDGPGPSARFNLPTSIVVAPSGDLYVTDYNNGAIRKITFE